MKPPRPHSVLALEDDLLLVFKPAGHAEPTHVHDYDQTLHLLRGRLSVRIGAAEQTLSADRPHLRIRKGTPHSTLADEATWLAVERGR
jgi:quercetin dioxygenase-like cupin family protein